MNAKMGMNPDAAELRRSSLQSQINALTGIISDLGTTHSAAQNPQWYGIDPGERTIAPWSMHTLSSARHNLLNASNSANSLLSRLTAEIGAQRTASGNAFLDVTAGIYGGFQTVSWWRRWVSWPRTLLELPAAIRMLAMQPSAWGTGLNMRNWWLAGTSAGGQALKAFTLNSKTPLWIRRLYVAGNNLKIQNVVNPAYNGQPWRHAMAPKWIEAMYIKNPGVVAGIGKAATIAGKGFAVLGAVGGVVNLATGIHGMMDGDISSEDAWAVADGAVGLITSIGSFAPPPVGLVFAGVGLAYSAGRWLFGEDENGNTGLDHIGNAAKAVGSFTADVATNIGKGAVAVGSALVDAGSKAVEVIKDLWPW